MTTPDLRDRFAMADDDDGTCWKCGGEGSIESCMESTCVCLDPPCCERACDICRGSGVIETPRDHTPPELREVLADSLASLVGRGGDE